MIHIKISKLIFVAVLFLVGIGGYYLGKQRNTSPIVSPSPTTIPTLRINTPTPLREVTLTDDWVLFENKDEEYSFRHPKDLTPKKQDDGTVTVEKWGPTQKEDTEFYDGISIVFDLNPLEGKTLSEVVEENRKGTEEISGEVVAQPTMISASGIEGLTYSAMGHEYYYYVVRDGVYILILNLTNDPGELGYEEIAQKIIQSVNLKY